MDKNLRSTIPKLVAADILRTLENNLIAKKICTMKSKTEITKKGDTVYFTGLADPTVYDYEGVINYEKLQDGSVTLQITEARVCSFKVGDIESFQAEMEVKGSQQQRSMYSLRNDADKFVLNQYKLELDNLTVVDIDEITSANVLSSLADVFEELEDNNVEENMRFGVLTPWMKQKLILSGIIFQINNGMEGERGGINYTNYQGTECMVSNNVAQADDGDYLMPFGSYNSLVFEHQMTKTRLVELQTSFDDGFAALYVYGAKVIKPKEIVILRSKKGAETAI